MIRSLLWLGLALALLGCEQQQSAFAAAGEGGARIALLTWVLIVGGSVILVAMCTLIGFALFGNESWRRRLAHDRNIVWGGIVFPVVVLSLLLIYGFVIMRSGAQLAAAEDALRITVIGEQWWWRVRYHHADGTYTESANELRLPVGRPVALALESADVIHSFWLPAYGGKVDMIPGRTNHLHLNVRESGVVRGQCAEYCGGAHALMSFFAVALSPADFEAWLANERGPRAARAGEHPGEQLFLASGCGGCHQVRGTAAAGTIGPDLTHLGGRLSVGAGIMETSVGALETWIAEHQRIKPENLMPPFEFFTEEELTDLATYLSRLD